MKVNTIPSEWMYRNSTRLDSSPYLMGAFEVRMVLEKLPVPKQPLWQLTSGHNGGIYNGPQFVRNYVDDPEFGLPFITGSSMLQSDLSNINLLSKKDALARALKHLELQEGMTLISCSGSIGRMVYCRPSFQGMWSSQDVLKVVPDRNKIAPGYLFAFMSSKFGVPQVLAGEYGAVIRHLEPEHIHDLSVPIAPASIQDAVHALITEMGVLRSESAIFYQEATQLLFENLGLTDISRHTWMKDVTRQGYQVSSISPLTLRALNFVPGYTAAVDELQKRRFDPLGSLCKPEGFRSGIIFKRVDADEEFGVRLVGQKESFQVRPEGRWISRKSIEGLGLMVPPGTTVIAAHGTLGETELYCRSAYVTNRTSEYAFSGDFVRCIPLENRIRSGYLFAFLRSQTAFRMLRCISIGSKQQAPHMELLWNLPVPRVADNLELRIHNLIQEGAHKFDRSLELEEEAWHIVENWIEDEADAR